MSNPKIYGFDDAGCKWETIHKNDHNSIIASINSRIDSLGEKIIPIVWNDIPQSLFKIVYDICYANGKYIAVGQNSSSKPQMADSIDGITWNAISQTIFTREYIKSICYGNGMYVAVGFSGQLAYSTDGITWTQAVKGLTTSNFNSVCYGDGKFVVGRSDGNFLYSTDGINWTSKGSGFGSSINSICYGNGRFVAVGGDGNNFYSTDGITWKRASGVSPGESLIDVCYGDGKFVATRSGSNIIYYSENGETWNDKTFSDISTSNPSSICYVSGKFIMIKDGDIVCISSDLNTSIIVNTNWLGDYYSLNYFNHRYFTSDDSGTMKYSQVGV